MCVLYWLCTTHGCATTISIYDPIMGNSKACQSSLLGTKPEPIIMAMPAFNCVICNTHIATRWVVYKPPFRMLQHMEIFLPTEISLMHVLSLYFIFNFYVIIYLTN